MQIPPTCMCADELSLVRNETSSALSRSMCPCAMRLTYPPMRRFVPACLAALLLLAGCGGDDHRRGAATSAFDGDRAFADLEAQVEFGPRPAGSPAAHRTAEWIAGRMRDGGLARRPRPVAVGERRRDDPGLGAGHGRRRRALRHQERHPGLRRRQRRRLGRRRAARAGARAAAPASRARRCSWSPSTPRRRATTANSRSTARAAAASTSPTRAAAGGDGARAAGARSARWSSSTWSATATCRSRASRTPTRRSIACSPMPRPRHRRAGAVRGPHFAIDDDHVPFLEAGVPAVDLIDFDYGPGPTPRRATGTRPRTRSTRSAPRAWTRWARRRWPRSRGSADRPSIAAPATLSACLKRSNSRPEARAARRAAWLLRRRRSRRPDGRARARHVRAARLRPQGDRPQQARGRAARRSAARSSSRRRPRSRRASWSSSPPTASRRACTPTPRRATCGRSTPPARS